MLKCVVFSLWNAHWYPQSPTFPFSCSLIFMFQISIESLPKLKCNKAYYQQSENIANKIGGNV